MGLFDKKNKDKAAKVTAEQVEKAEVKVLMCAGRRVGKTSIMAAIVDNLVSQFPEGNVIVNVRPACSDGSNPLDVFREKQQQAFRDWQTPFYYAEESNQTGASDESTASHQQFSYVGDVRVRNPKGELRLVNTINFRDPRGEDFTDSGSQTNVIGWIRESQVLMIAVDTPRLMECNQNGTVGAYHEEFNKPEEITNLIQQAWQGNKEERLILFVPLKCELYLKEGRGQEIIERVKEGYAPLIKYATSGMMAGLCSVAIAPCETMGGLEFRKFEPLNGYDENKPATGIYRSVYGYRRNEKGLRYYAPRCCEQPLLYMLLFVFGMRQRGKTGNGLFGMLSRMPSYEDLRAAHESIYARTKRNEDEGFCILNNPQGIL